VAYLILKALHVAAAMTFIGGLLASALMLRTLRSRDDLVPTQQLAQSLRSWNAWVTTPAMLTVWALGLTLGLRGGWFSFGWLHMKLPIVLALSALHGFQSALLRQRAGGRAVNSQWLQHALALILGGSILIVLLAYLKPL
jgi:protoporphyrinogen IX oxidase